MTTSIGLLIVPQRPFPSDHAMLETVYTRHLPAEGYRVSWVMHTREVGEDAADWNGTPVHLVRLPTRASAASTHALTWLLTLRAAWRFARPPEIDILQVRNLIGAGLLGLMLRRVRGIRVSYQFSFPIPEALIEAAKARRTRWPRLQRALASAQLRCRRFLLRRADLVLAISPAMREQLVRQGVDPARVVIAPMGADDVPPVGEDDTRRLRSELGVESPCIIYFGVIAPERELSFLVDVAARLQAMGHAAQWMLVGRSVDGEAERLATGAERCGVSRFQIIDRVPRSELPRYLSMASIAVSPIPVNDLYRASSPTKTVEALNMGIPVVATPIPEQAGLLESSGGGLVAPFEVGAFSEAVAALLEDPAGAVAMGRAGQAYVQQHRSYSRLAKELDVTYRRLIHGELPADGEWWPPRG